VRAYTVDRLSVMYRLFIYCGSHTHPFGVGCLDILLFQNTSEVSKEVQNTLSRHKVIYKINNVKGFIALFLQNFIISIIIALFKQMNVNEPCFVILLEMSLLFYGSDGVFFVM